MPHLSFFSCRIPISVYCSLLSHPLLPLSLSLSPFPFLSVTLSPFLSLCICFVFSPFSSAITFQIVIWQSAPPRLLSWNQTTCRQVIDSGKDVFTSRKATKSGDMKCKTLSRGALLFIHSRPEKAVQMPFAPCRESLQCTLPEEAFFSHSRGWGWGVGRGAVEGMKDLSWLSIM